MAGFIVLSRFFDKEWGRGNNPTLTYAFIKIIFNANYKETKWRGRVVERGSFITSISRFSSETGLSPQQTRSCWRILKQDNLIKVESCNQWTKITVCNYDSFQMTPNGSSNYGNNPEITNSKNIKEIAPKESGSDSRFIKTYLRQVKRVTDKGAERFKKTYIIGGGKISDKDIKQIASLPYSEFLETRYWKLISHIVKIDKGFACELCGSKEHLEVHHTSYEHHGDEAHHLEDLICLCHKCHSKQHGKED